MKRLLLMSTLVLGVVIWIGAFSSTPSASPSVMAVPSSPVSSPVNKNILLREFLKAQKSEIKALEHQQRFEIKELRASQDAREREWKKAEDDARHRFFETHSKGAERRAYVQEFILRRDALRKLFNDERNQRKQEHDARIAAIRQDQSLRFKDFKQAVDKGTSPASALWPKPGH